MATRRNYRKDHTRSNDAIYDGTNWFGFIKAYRDGLARAGHDPMGTEILGKFHIYVSSSLEKASEEAEPYLTGYYDVHRAADPNRKEQGLMVHRTPTRNCNKDLFLPGIPSTLPIAFANGARKSG